MSTELPTPDQSQGRTPIALSTSAIPFLAAIQGRRRIDWRGIGWLRPIGGIVLFGALVAAHGWFAGVALLP